MYQEINIIGHLGSAPEMRYFQDGTAVTNFSVAVNNNYTSKATGERIEETVWFRVSATGPMAENANQYLDKGSKVFVKGRLKFDKSTGGPVLFTRRDNTVGSSFEIQSTTIKFLSSRDESLGGGASAPSYASAPAVVEEDDIPF